MNRLLNTSSITGSAVVPMAFSRVCGDGAGQHHVVESGDGRLPAGLNHRGVVRLDDQGRACHRHAWHEPGAVVKRRVMPFAAGVDFRLAHVGGFAIAERVLRLGGIRSAANRFHRHRLDDDFGAGRGKAELRLVRGLELGPHPVGCVEVDVQG
jgi:hypothetical protein